MTAVDVLGRVDELTDGTGGSVEVVMGAAIGPYRESRLSTRNAVLASLAAYFHLQTARRHQRGKLSVLK